MRLFATLLFTFSVPVFACPKLAGKYHCLNHNDRTREEIVMYQENRGGVEVYTFRGPELPADNILRNLPESEDFRQGTLRAWCDGDFLRTKYTGKIFRDGLFLGNLTARQSFQKYDTVLTIITKGDVSGGGLGARVDEELYCEEMTP